jgi:hypothetical protein
MLGYVSQKTRPFIEQENFFVGLRDGGGWFRQFISGSSFLVGDVENNVVKSHLKGSTTRRKFSRQQIMKDKFEQQSEKFNVDCASSHDPSHITLKARCLFQTV